MTVDLNAVPAEGNAPKQALTDLLSQLECQTDVAHASAEEIDAAHAEVTKDMGW